MKDDRADYIRRLHFTRHGIVRRLLADVLLFTLFVAFGLMINSFAA